MIKKEEEANKRVLKMEIKIKGKMKNKNNLKKKRNSKLPLKLLIIDLEGRKTTKL